MTEFKARNFHLLLFIINLISILGAFSWSDRALANELNQTGRSGMILTRARGPADGTQVSPTSGDDYGTINISWTAPGDDSLIGRADHYVIKYNTIPLDDSNWDQSPQIADPPPPVDPGQDQSFLITGLNAGTFYYLAIKTYDDAGNISPISNIASKYASGIPRPLPLGADVDSVNSLAILSARTVISHLSVYYEFALDTTETFVSPRIDFAMIADTTASVTFGNLAPSVTYFWRCRAMAQDHSDSSFWSNDESFQLQSRDMIAPQVTIISPSDGDTVNTDTVLISWEAHDNVQVVQYYVGYSTDAGQNWVQLTQGNDSSGSYNWLLSETNGRLLIGVLCLDQAQNAGGDTVSIFRNITSTAGEQIPGEFSLEQSYPNPFNAEATIRYSLPVASYVSLEIYDLLGKLITTAIRGEQAAGYHQYIWQANQFPSGTYLYKIKAGNFEMVKKALLIK